MDKEKADGLYLRDWDCVSVPVAAIVDQELSDTGFRLFSYLVLYQGRSGGRWPTTPVLMLNLHKSRRAIQRARIELGKLGYLVTVEDTKTLVAQPEREAPGTDADNGERSAPPIMEQHRAMVSALATVCRIDLSVATRKTWGMLNQAAAILRAAGHTIEDVERFRQWWYSEDWRGKDGYPPTVAQVRSEWGRMDAPSSETEKERAASPTYA